MDKGAKRKPRVMGAKGEARRESIMDAAEQVFAELGYYGSTLREVSARCGAALGLISHYFESKDDLFRDVVARRLPLLSAMIRASIDAALARPDVTTSEIVRGFVAPFLQIGADPASPLHHYVRLTSHFMSSYRDPHLTPTLRTLQPISHMFSDALRGQWPNAPEERFLSAVYLVESALVFMTQDQGFLEDLAGSRASPDKFHQLVDDTVEFFCGGIERLLAA
jgi:AcrR family transcriptional regulator